MTETINTGAVSVLQVVQSNMVHLQSKAACATCRNVINHKNGVTPTLCTENLRIFCIFTKLTN